MNQTQPESTPRLLDLVIKWRDMPPDALRLRAGEMTAQEIRTVRAVLSAILADHQAPEEPDADKLNTKLGLAVGHLKRLLEMKAACAKDEDIEENVRRRRSAKAFLDEL